MERAIALESGSLWPAVEAATAQAAQSGTLRPIETQSLTLPDAGVDFVVTHTPNRPHNAAASGQTSHDDPFLSAKANLYLGDLSDTHYCALSESSIYDHELLIVTREFEHQETLLRMRDFIAMCTCLREYDGLGFYDAGPTAGATEIHKHLRLVPLPLAGGELEVPMMSVLAGVDKFGVRIRNAPALPFAHAFGWIGNELFDEPLRAGEVTYDLYVDMMEMLGMRGTRTDGEFRQPVPYNMLLTRRWMLLVPRSQAAYTGVTVSGLVFAGSMLVENDEQLSTLREHGPMNTLRDVSKPRL